MDKSRRISKKRAGDLAIKVLGNRKIVMEGDNGYFYSAGEISLKIWDYSVQGSRSSYRYFNLNGEWYSLPVIWCTIWIGDYYSREFYYTFNFEEICYEWKQDDG